MNNKYADAEIFKTKEIKGLVYKIGNHGTIIGPQRGEVKQRYSKDGYRVVTVGALNQQRSQAFVHRLVAELFVDNLEGKEEVNHKDFNRENNHYTNLEWVTHQENIDYTLKNNYETFCKGSQGCKNGRSVFTKNEVLKIRKLYKEGKNIMEIIKIFYPNYNYEQRKNVWNRFKRVINGETWKSV